MSSRTRARRDHRILLVFRPHMRKAVVGFGINYGPLFDPADFVFVGLHLEKPASVFQDLERLPVHNCANAVGYGCHSIVKVHLPGRNIDGLMLLVA